MNVFPVRLSTLVAVAAIIASSGCSNGDKPALSGPPQVIRGLTVVKTAGELIPESFAAAGTVRAATVANIAARVQGTVTTVHVREGDRVAKGQLLVTLEAQEAQAGAAGAKAAVDEAGRAVAEAAARKQLADETFGRYKRLLDEQAVTRQEFDTRRTERDIAMQALARSEARLAQAREQAKSAVALADHTRILAPLTGVVSVKSIERGSTVFPGMPLLSLEEQGKYRLEAALPETLAANVKRGREITVKIDGMTQELRGTVAEVAPVADPVTRTCTVKVDIPGAGLRSGMFGRAFFPTGTTSAILLPRSALVERGMLTSVWVVDKEHIARMRLIKPGRRVGERVEILAGLSEGERVVTDSVEKVVEGAQIQ